MRQVSFTYPDAKKQALRQIDLAIEEGEFVVACGQSGSGKSTLLRLFKRELAPYGERSGEILYKGKTLESLEDRESAAEIGFVLQNPQHQIVTDKVWSELAFGLENLGLDKEVIRLRVGETANYFGIHSWFRKNTDELSGGQQQLLNLASVIAMSPKVLILDEPASQLDPIAASEFLTTLKKLNEDLGLTILLVEHRLEEAFSMADKVLVLEEGSVLQYDTPQKVSAFLKDHAMLRAMPAAVRLFHAFSYDEECPLNVKEGKAFIKKHFPCGGRMGQKTGRYKPAGEPVFELKEVWFRYDKEEPDIMRGVNLSIYPGERFFVLGGNGCGKTTLLYVMAGIYKAYRGKILLWGRRLKEYSTEQLFHNNVAVLPQNPQTVFLKNTVREDLEEICLAMHKSKEESRAEIEQTARRFGLMPLLEQHPYDLSGGEQQKCAVAKVLLTKPKVLLMDEPTKGLDGEGKAVLAELLEELKKSGLTTVTVTHDVEFAAENSDRCGLFFDGEMLAVTDAMRFFAGNHFYTTAANRMTRGLFEGVVTVRQLIEICKKNQ